MPTPWHCLEQIPGFAAVPKIWRGLFGKDFETFTTAFFQKWPRPAASFPCPLKTSCAYWLIHQPAGAIIGICQRDPRTCENVTLTLAEVTPLQLNWHKLARALCRAFECDSKTEPFDLPNTLQIGSWSADAVPIILTIQFEHHDLRNVIVELGFRLQRPFILLAPTSTLMTASCDARLAQVKAAFFPLETTVLLTEHGTLLPRKAPGELFRQFTPEEKLPEDAAMRAFAIAKSLDSEPGIRKAPLFTVFRLYCMEGLSVEQVAKKLHCSKATIINRLRLLRKRTGTDPENLRAYSAQFSRIEDSLSDSRAKRIHRQSAIDDSPPEEED